jgi:DNA-binding GntR family transcriptional regulator
MASPLKTIDRPPSLGDQVYASLRDSIRSGRFKSGQPLQEAAIAGDLGVSRTPVREVLARLASEGLIHSEGRGYIVPILSAPDIEDIYELRLMVEPEVMRKVASLIDGRGGIRPFRAELAAMVAADEAGDATAFTEANYRFRDAWLSLETNKRLLRVIEQYSDHVRLLRAITLDDPATRKIVIKGLRAVTNALAAGNGDAAAKAMRAHLQQALRILHAEIGAGAGENGDDGISR